MDDVRQKSLDGLVYAIAVIGEEVVDIAVLTDRTPPIVPSDSLHRLMEAGRDIAVLATAYEILLRTEL